MLKFAFIKLYNIFLKKIEKYKNDRYKVTLLKTMAITQQTFVFASFWFVPCIYLLLY